MASFRSPGPAARSGIRRRGRLMAGCLALQCLAAWQAGADPLGQALDATVAGQRQAQDSQARIDVLADQTREMASAYRDAMRQADQLEAYVAQIERLVAAQKAELDARAAELAGVEDTRARSLPLLREMWRALRDFVQLDLPFLANERGRRVAELERMLDQPGVTMAEKYRRLIEAYQVEAEYGRTVEASRDVVKLDDGERTVDVLRVGRIGLYYVELDGSSASFWDVGTHAWKTLSGADRAHVERALLVARKAVPPEWLEVPLDVAEARP